MSYFGHAYQALDYFRSGSSWYDINSTTTPDYYDAPFGNKEHFDMTKAIDYFEKCRNVTSNDTLAARATFMAAKCELNAFYQDPKTTYNGVGVPKLPLQYRNYYDLLKTKYNTTPVYQKAIEECKFFKYYVAN